MRDQPGYLKKPAVEEELTAALTAWAPACGLVFEKAKAEAGAKIVFGFHGQDGDATYIFDGPGGCLAQVVRAAEKGAGDGNGPDFIKFDEEEKWLLPGDAISVADMAVGAYVKYGQLFFRMDISSMPNLARFMKEVESRPAFKSTVAGG